MKKKKKPDFSKPKQLDATQEIQQINAEETDYSESYEEKPVHEKLKDGISTKQFEGLPLVVIAGRPNVGKSTLFNRFMQRRLAIVDPTPGVTRDPVERTAVICGKPVHLMDTGGYKLQRDIGTMEAKLDELVVERSLEMIQKADLILLLLEASQITGEDEEFIKQLRPHWSKVIAAVNKTEGGKNESLAWNYAKFGFEKMFFISAEHGDNISPLAETIVSRLDFSNVKEIEDNPPIKIAIMGKPNTGKSTLSNRLTHTEASIVVITQEQLVIQLKENFLTEEKTLLFLIQQEFAAKQKLKKMLNTIL